MSTDPDQIRDDIERTRAELSSDVDALTDKVSPTQVAQRQADRSARAVSDVKDRVMGAASAVPTTSARRRPPSATRRPASARRRRVCRTRPRTRPAGTRWPPG